ncbi:MAG TPA: hypothetical protein VFS20_03475 [Longimicrobium sp.]|nr:hypothetical protein [Longimicrobium sp.]
MPDGDLFLGSWELIPELSLYEFGPLPASCTYEISEHDERVHVCMRWAMSADGPESRTEFAGPGDGSRQRLPGSGEPPPEPVSFSLTRVDERTLESRAFRGDHVFAFARRVASTDGELLAIVQEGESPEGSRFRNFQVYRRLPVSAPGSSMD